MGLSTIFGINGVGKDTVVEEIIRKCPSIKSTSVSRINMYILGITNTYDLKEKVTEEQYKLLEETPQEKMIEIENNQYREILKYLSQRNEDTIFIGHLISALRLGENIKYLTDRITPEWFVTLNKKLIQLKAPIELIAKRRVQDKSRKRTSDIYEIQYHQKLCDDEWNRIKNLGVQDKMYIVDNIDLNKTVKEVTSILYPEIEKSSQNKFAKELSFIVNSCRYLNGDEQDVGKEGEAR